MAGCLGDMVAAGGESVGKLIARAAIICEGWPKPGSLLDLANALLLVYYEI